MSITMSPMRPANVILALICQFFLFIAIAVAHPSSGILIDRKGHVYFFYRGLVRMDATGGLTAIQEETGGHWLALDEKNVSSKAAPAAYKRVTMDGATFLFGDGAPLTMGTDVNLFYAGSGSQEDPFSPGVKTVVKLTAPGSPCDFLTPAPAEVS